VKHRLQSVTTNELKNGPKTNKGYGVYTDKKLGGAQRNF